MPTVNEFEDFKSRVRDFLKRRDQFYKTYIGSDWMRTHESGVSSSLKEQLKQEAQALLQEDSDIEDTFADTFSGEDEFEGDEEWSLELLGRLAENDVLNGIRNFIPFLERVPTTTGGRKRTVRRRRNRKTRKARKQRHGGLVR